MCQILLNNFMLTYYQHLHREEPQPSNENVGYIFKYILSDTEIIP